MALSSKQKNFLRGLAHHIPVSVSIGNAGASEAVISEISQTFTAHELLKLKLPGLKSADKKILINDICEKTACEFVQLIGHVAVIYQPGDPAKIELP